MHAAKQEALETIGKLPDDTDMDEIMYRLYVLDKIRKGQQAVEQGQTVTSEELKREIDSSGYRNWKASKATIKRSSSR